MAVVAVVGTTSWGATLAALAARNGHEVRLVARSRDEAAEVNRTRRVARVPAFELPPGVIATADAAAAAQGADAALVVVPSQTLRGNIRPLRGVLGSSTVVVHATKGLERESAKRMSEIVCEELPGSAANVCALSGPNLAPEIQRGLPAATVIAGREPTVARAQALLHQPAFRVYASDDLVGLELAGALKNVVALAAGIADGLEFGDNAKAGIITRGLAEITRLGVAAGADPMTFAGLAGMGDVMATCYSPLSRNRRTGEAIARGASVADAIGGAGGIVEGAEATRSAGVLAGRLGIDMPITSALSDVLFAGAAPLDVVRRLLEREPKREGG